MNYTDLCKVSPLNSATAELSAQVTHQGQISSSARSDLMTVLSNSSLSTHEKDLIKRLLYAVRRDGCKFYKSFSFEDCDSPREIPALG
jgi:hypothetical protein